MREFFIKDDNIHLHAKLDMPKGVEMAESNLKCPLVIIFHGLTGDMEERHITAVQEAVNELGFAALRVEMYGHGMSEGDFREHTLFKWISNAMKTIEYAKSLDFVTDLFMAGHSQGGLLTILAAGMRPDDFRAILPMSPALNIPDGARSGELLGIAFDPAHIPETFMINELELKDNYLRTAQLLHAEDAIARYKGPVLIVHGDADESVPYRYSAQAAKLYENCEFVTIANDDHCYNYHLREVIQAVRQFLSSFC